MGSRYFEGKEHTLLYQQFRAKPPPTLIEHVVCYLKEKYEGELKLMVDVGCGSGQNTFPYSSHFENIIGLDVSPNQIQVAREQITEKSNVTFEVSPAEKTNLKDGSVQLVAAMAAAHWFDLPKFFEEVKRILTPGGVLAIYIYSTMDLANDDGSTSSGLRNFHKKVFQESALSKYWPSNVQSAIDGYTDIIIPMDDFVRDNNGTFYDESRLNVAQIIGSISTYSSFIRLRELKGEEAAQRFLNELQTELLELSGHDRNKKPDQVYFNQKTPFSILMARKLTN